MSIEELKNNMEEKAIDVEAFENTVSRLIKECDEKKQELKLAKKNLRTACNELLKLEVKMLKVNRKEKLKFKEMEADCNEESLIVKSDDTEE